MTDDTPHGCPRRGRMMKCFDHGKEFCPTCPPWYHETTIDIDSTVYECCDCGAFVWDTSRHTRWHKIMGFAE